MIAVLCLVYGMFYVLFFKKLKLFSESVRNISVFVGFGVVMIGGVVFAWWTFAPTTVDGRVFQYVIPIVPNVKGQVVEVPIEGNQHMQQGEVLYRIDPTPYKFKVEQLEAAIDQAKAQKTLAELQVKRASGLVKSAAGPQADLDQWNATLVGARAAIIGLQAQLGDAQWRLDETVVRAPYSGHVVNLQLRPGNFVTTIPMGSSLAFVSDERSSVLASFSQSAIRYISVGDAVEMVFLTNPGEVVAGKIARIIKASGSTQMKASGQLPVMTGIPENSRWTAVIDFDDEADAKKLPQSAGASMIAVYTQKGKPVHVISMVVLRVSAWMTYLTSP